MIYLIIGLCAAVGALAGLCWVLWQRWKFAERMFRIENDGNTRAWTEAVQWKHKCIRMKKENEELRRALQNGRYSQFCRWIPCSEELPESGRDRHLIIARLTDGGWLDGYRTIEIARYHPHDGAWAFPGDIAKHEVTHWMPLPEMPAETE